jgi:hypothetical protein
MKNEQLCVVDWLWDIWEKKPKALPVPFTRGSLEELRKLRAEGTYTFVIAKPFVLVYEGGSFTPAKEELYKPLEDDYFFKNGRWNNKLIWNELNLFAKLEKIYFVR